MKTKCINSNKSETYRSNAFKGGMVDVGKDVGFRVAKNLEGYGAMVIFQRRDVVVAYRQLGARVYLVTIRTTTINDNFFYKF